MKNKHTAVFDFDKTIISKDTFYEFMFWLSMQSCFRSFFFIILSPVVFLLVATKKFRIQGVNIFCFISTFFQKKSKSELTEEFIDYYIHHKNAVIFPDAVNEIERHKESGKSILIISGSPQWLVEAVLKAVGISECAVIGTKLKSRQKALLISDYCYGKNKLTMVYKNGFKTSNWSEGYTDSTTDLPFLKECKKKFIINPSKKTEVFFSANLQGDFQIKRWE